MSLSRRWLQQGRQTEARELLAPVYGWFTEGVDVSNLREAKALLEELNLSGQPGCPLIEPAQRCGVRVATFKIEIPGDRHAANSL